MPGREPLVTVGVATYNGAKFLARTLSSILNGSYSNIELLMVDDGSSDDSVAIAKRVNDSRIRVISNSVNGGLVKTRQQIMEETRGTYLAWLDQDDIAYPNRISAQIAFLERNEKVGVCGSWTMHRVHEPSGKEWLLKSRASLSLHSEIRASMPFNCPISFNTATMRMSAFRNGDLRFREEYGNTLDYDMWSRAADVMELRNIKEFLGEYRVHPNQTSRGSAADHMLEAAWSVQREVLKRNLGVQINADADAHHIHRRMTLSARSLVSESDALEVGTWLRFLADRNYTIGAYQERAFDNAVSRQWVLCLLHVSRNIGFTKAIKLAGASRSITGFGTNNLSNGVRSFMQNQGSVMVQKLINGRL
ncbi:glycosyltransferase [Actinomycetota bacterium]|nr:glycosyltransferase [Actinomycetota bacterium]